MEGARGPQSGRAGSFLQSPVQRQTREQNRDEPNGPLVPGRSRHPGPPCFRGSVGSEMVKEAGSRMAPFLSPSMTTYLRLTSTSESVPTDCPAPEGPRVLRDLLAHPAGAGSPDEIVNLGRSALLDSAGTRYILALLLSWAARKGRKRAWGSTCWVHLIALSKSAAGLGARVATYRTWASWAPTNGKTQARVPGDVMQLSNGKADYSVKGYIRKFRLRRSKLRWPPGLAASHRTCGRQPGAVIPQAKVVTVCIWKS